MKTITLLTDMEQNCLFIRPEKYEEVINALRERGFDITDSANGIKNTEIAPKYDPCRLFKKGDIVEPCQANGRWLSPPWEHRTGIRYEVTEDENPITADLYIKDPDSPEPFLTHAAFFNLVTPVEEREPYKVEESIFIKDEWKVWKDGGDKTQTLIATYTLAHPNAKAAAEAERDRLNAEYRKEQNHD